MTKAELSKKIAEASGQTIKDVNSILDAFTSIIKEQVINGNEVTLRGFGTFKMKHRGERKARNIKEGTEITIPPKDVPTFKPSSQFFETTD